MGSVVPGFTCRSVVGAESVTCANTRRWFTIFSEQARSPLCSDQAGIIGMSQSQKEEIGLIENSSAYLTIKSRSELTSGEAFRVLLIMKCFKWQRKRASGAHKTNTPWCAHFPLGLIS